MFFSHEKEGQGVRMSQCPLGEHWDSATGRQRTAEQDATISLLLTYKHSVTLLSGSPSLRFNSCITSVTAGFLLPFRWWPKESSSNLAPAFWIWTRKVVSFPPLPYCLCPVRLCNCGRHTGCFHVQCRDSHIHPCSLGCGKSLSFLFCLYSFLAQICTNPCTSCLYSNTVFLGLQCSSETLSGGLFLETQPKFSLLMQCRTGLETGLSSQTVSLMHLFENKFIPIGGLEFHYG